MRFFRLPLGGIRARGVVAAIAAAAATAGCNEHFTTGGRDSATLEFRTWTDTLVVGEQRASRVRAVDADGREIVGARVTWQTATPAVLGAHAYGQPAGSAPAGATVEADASTDSLALTGVRAGTSDVLVALADSRFAPTQLTRRATVVVAGVGVTSAHDTTVTSLGDTARVTGTAYMRSGGTATGPLTPLAGQGLTWTRQGPGAITLVGTGDSVRAIANVPGTDTLIATHAYCLAHARCADTTVVHVVPALQGMSTGATAYRAWAFGDTVAPQVIVQDARGHAIPGVQLSLVPLTAADSAIVGVNTNAGVPTMSRGTTTAGPVAGSGANGPLFDRSAPNAGAPASHASARPRLLLLVVGRARTATRTGIAANLAANVASPAPLSAPPLVAQANGTANVAVQVRLGDGTLLGADTVSVVVRQVAQVVRVAPAYSDLTPGDSIPVHVEARDARGHLIQDATFQPSIAGALYRDGRIVVPTTASAGTGALQAIVTGVASPANNPGAPIPTPPPDTARIAVRVPPVMPAGDTTASDANTLNFTVRDANGAPLPNTWVRFRIPAGTLQGPDSVQSDANGTVVLRWTLPTQPGSYTATAVLLSVSTPADTAGFIVLRRTAVVAAGAPAALAMTAQPPATSAMGVNLTPAPAVQLVDRFGNPVAQAGVTVTAGPAAGTTGFTWGGTLTATTGADGQAHFAALSGSGAAGSYAVQFAATVNGAAVTAATSNAVHFTTGVAQTSHTTVTISAPSITSGATATVVVTPRDAYNNTLGAGQTVTVTVPSAPVVGQATATASAVVDNGDGTYIATLTGVHAGTAFPVSVTVGGAPVTGPTLAVTAGAPATLSIATQPPTAAAMGVALAPAPVVQLLDHAGNPVPQAGITVTAAAATGSTGLTWGGTLTAATDASGRAQFANVTGSGAPGSYALQFTATISGAALTPATSGVVHFTIGGANAGHSTVVVSAPSIASGTTATVVVTPRDAYNNLLGPGQIVTVTVPGTPITGQATATVSAVVDNGDGTYTATLTGVRAGAALTIGATAGGVALTGPTLAVTPGAPAALTVVTQPPAASAMGVALTPAPVVQLLDHAGNTVQQAGITVTAAAATAASGFTWGGTLTATTGATGQAQFAGITGTGTPGSYALQFTATANTTPLTAVTSTAVQFGIGGANAGHSTVVVSAPSIASGTTATVVVTPRDAYNNLLGAGQTVTVTVPGAPAAGQATATASAVVDNHDGTYTATLTGVRAGTGFPIGATAGGVALTSPTLAVTAGAPAVLTILTQPPSAAAMGVALAPAPVVQVVDAAGNAVSQAGITVTAAAAAAGGSFTWGGTLTAATDASGQAHFAAITGSGTPGSYALQFSAAPLTAVTSTAVHFSIGGVNAGHTTVTVSAPSIASGATATVVVTPRDAYNNTLGAGQTVTVTVPSAPAAGQATATVSAVVDNGDGTYTATLTGVRAGTALTIGATAGGVALTAPTLAVTAGTPAALTLVTQPPAASAMGVALTPAPVVQVVDHAGNAVPQAGITVTAAAATGSTGLTWGGTLAATTSATGQAQFTNVAGSGTPGSYALQFTATVNAAALTPATSTPVQFATGSANAGHSTVVVSAPSITSGATATVTVTPRDAYNNLLGAGQVVTVTVPGAPVIGQATATVSAVTDRGDGTYTATLTGVRAGTGFPIGATAGGVTLTSPTLAVTAGAPAALTIATQPPATAGMSVALSPAPVVQVVDAAGNAVSQAGITVTAAAAAGSTGLTWGGTLTAATDASGRAQFANVTGSGTPGNYALQFTATTNGAPLTPATSTPVHFSAGGVNGSHSTVTVSASSIASGTTATVVVTPRDAYNNLLGPGQTITVTVPSAPAAGQATATVSAVVDNGDGTYTATLTGVRAGTALAIGATAGGVALTAPTLAVTPGAAATLVVSPASATLNAFGAGTPFTATAADLAGNAVSTAGLTWSSAHTAVATIAATGTPTAVTNGSTTITATLGSASGTATVTVLQRVATLAKQAGDGQTATVGTGVTTAPAVVATDANGNPVVGASVQFAVASGAGTVGGGASQTVTTGAGGVATAGAWVLGGTTGANTLTASTTGVTPVTFTATGSAALAISVTAIERLPGGTEQFGVTAGPSGPYTWSVGGVDGGNATYGTVSSSGLYTAPSSVPSPNVVQLCVRVGPAATQRSCAAVTINATPTAGADVVVLNDMNVVSNASLSGLEQSNGSSLHPENVQFVTNLISFTSSAPRASQTHALFYLGAGSQCATGSSFNCDPTQSGSNLARLAGVWTGLGYSSTTTTSLTSIPANVKLV
ncbi:MAG TPA: Ig-like domain-containing protein, partial [Gemmatirosa sp.]